MARLSSTINLASQTFYTAYALGKHHLMNAKHAERIIAAKNSKPEYVNPNADNEYDHEAYRAYLNTPAYRAYERAYRLALAESRVVCSQKQQRVYATPSNTPAVPSNLPANMCVKCMSHVV